MITKSFKTIYPIIVFLIIGSIITNCSKQQTPEQNNEFKIIKAAHYFSNTWPKTFWQEFELGKVESELSQIKKDGFNTIVLVIPWRGFEFDFSNSNTKSNPALYQRLDFLLEKITNIGLNYILRVGFPHNFDPSLVSSISEPCSKIYTEEKTQTQWLSFLKKLDSKTKKHQSNQSGVLISWEDFWCPHFVFPYLDYETRLQLSKQLGYDEWLFNKDPVILKIILGKNEIKQSEISLPTKSDGDYFYYIQFIDEKFNQLILNPAKKVFPQAAMEIRIDKDPAKGMNNENIWISHDLHFQEKNHRGTYWAPFWGADNQGETISLKQALFNFEYFLNYVSDQGKSTNHVIEQFNFTDNTPYFPNNAKLAEDEVDEFLIASVPLLKKYSEGYGVWAYKDYADNALYNSSFELDLEGWLVSGKLETIIDKQDHQLKLEPESSITQNYMPAERFMLARSYKQLNLCIDTIQAGTIEIYANQLLQKELKLEKGNHCYILPAPAFIDESGVEFKLKAKTTVILDELKLYGFVQILGLYDEFGKPATYLNAIKEVNRLLDQ